MFNNNGFSDLLGQSQIVSNIASIDTVTVNSDIDLSVANVVGFPINSTEFTFSPDGSGRNVLTLNTSAIPSALLAPQAYIPFIDASVVSGLHPGATYAFINTTGDKVNTKFIMQDSTLGQQIDSAMEFNNQVDFGFYSTNGVLSLDSTAELVSTNLSDGELMIGHSGNPAVASTLTAGTNMVITNGTGSITLAPSLTPIFTSVTTPYISLTDTTNQIRTNGRNYTVIDTGTNSNFLMTDGNQDITGLKTWFDIPRIFGHNYIQFGNLGRIDNNTQILLKYPPAGGDYSIDFADSAISHAYTIPDTGVNSGIFIMDRGNQTINSIKTFLSEIILGKASGQLIIQPGGSGFKFTIDSTNPAANRTYSLIDVGKNASFLMTDSTTPQTLFVPTNDRFYIKGDNANSPPTQFQIEGRTSANYWMTIGIDTTNNKSVIQSGTTLSTPLHLNPIGGNMRLGGGSSQIGVNCNPGISYGSNTYAVDILGDVNMQTDVNMTGNVHIGLADGTKNLRMNYSSSGNYGAIDAIATTGKPLYINYSSGPVGINLLQSTSLATQALHIGGVGANNDIMAFYDNSGPTKKWHIALPSGGVNIAESGVADYRIYINTGGNVGIGNNNNTYKLDVSGSIKSTSCGSIKNPVCMIRRDTTQAINQNTTTQIIFTAAAGGIVEIDTDSMANLANSRIVIQRDGIYRITGYMNYAANASGNRACHLLRNGAVVAESTCIGTAGYQNTFQCVGIAVCSASDLITLSTTHSSATTPLNCSSAGPNQFTCKLQVDWISAS